MGDLVAASDSISPLTAILWCFYPMATLVLIELIMRAVNDDDDDDFQAVSYTHLTLPTKA